MCQIMSVLLMVKRLAIRLIALIIIKNLNVSIIGLSVLTILSIGAARVATGGVELNGLYSTDFVMGLMITLTLFVAILSYLSRAKVSRKARFNLMVIRISLILVIRFRVRRFFLFFFFFRKCVSAFVTVNRRLGLSTRASTGRRLYSDLYCIWVPFFSMGSKRALP